MAGYPRRPGAPPLSRARSLVVPDAPAFYERRSWLPQLDCERPRGRELDSHLLGIRPTFMCYVPSRVLASVGDTDFGCAKGRAAKPGPLGARDAHFGDDKPEDAEEPNPFSFKEFLKSKSVSLSAEHAGGAHTQEASRHTLGFRHAHPAPQAMGYGLEYSQPFFEDPTGSGDLLDEEEEDGWSGAYLPSTVEQTHTSRVPGSGSPCSTYLSFLSAPSELAGPESLPPWTLSDTDSRVSPPSPAGSPGTDFAAPGESLGDRHLRTLQMSYEALKEENCKLRRKLSEVHSFSETQTEMVRTLERKLEAKMVKEESDFHDLESVVQQVEQNLEMMTKRAVKAENCVLRLKQEVSLLQAQVSTYKRENEALRSGQGASLAVVKQNTDVALQNLRVVMSSAHASIKQLVSGAETLNLVAEILKSIDRISEVQEEDAS
ncbi:endosome-associated-trafficking regulator 1 isoform X1 [Ochotona princeps]|uniref:endosome-associated-trafficking regulator 1 isoform X1 n=1 Tax=Ochotona princeps TaxID=9978 RepID=UPI002714E544|nr:endosome-associated-trafficking regulator 1 isoform X1 [Ochotona princeps]